MQTRKALKSLSGGEVNHQRVSPNGPLASNAKWLLENYNRKQAETKAAQQRHDFAASLPALQAARAKIESILGEKALSDDTPIITRFDAFSAIKSASKNNPNDTGLKNFSIHLERLWHEDPMGSLSAGAISTLRDHYQHQAPRSRVGELTDQVIPKYSFNTLPVANLARIASGITNQEDYNIAMVQNGLDRDDPKSIRARAFIRELVNRKSAIDYCDACDKTADKCSCDMSNKKASLGTAKRSKSGDIATRIVSRFKTEAQEADIESSNTDVTAEPDTVAEDSEIKSEDLGINGSGMLMNAAIKEQEEMFNIAASTGIGISKEAVAPPGWEKTVEKMKDNPEIENPFALAWWMKEKGYKPSDKKDTKKESAKDKGPDQPEFHPDINEQQDDQQKLKEDGGKVLKASVGPDNPLVDDDCYHFPVNTSERLSMAVEAINKMNGCPDWWLGSKQELLQAVKTAGEIPEAFKENIKKMKSKSKDDKKDKDSKDDKKDASISYLDRCASFGLTNNTIENTIINGGSIKASGYNIKLNDSNSVVITSKTGSREYPVYEMDNAISDFMYLVGTTKQASDISPPPPMFFMREGLNITCPACNNAHSYEMPKQASDLACGTCDYVISSKIVASALENNIGASEETSLVVFVPTAGRNKNGDIFAKAANILETNDIGVDGAKAEAYKLNAHVEHKAKVWDFLVENGFKPLAQMSMPAGAPSVMAEGEPMMDIELPSPEMDIGDHMDEPNLGDMPEGDPRWADHQMIQAAMMHYQAQGMDPVAAIAQFSKDYGEGYDPETTIQVASTVFGIDTNQVKVALNKKVGDLPSTNVNQQQPDAVSHGKGDSVLGPDSETNSDIEAPKVNEQVPAQKQPGTSATSGDTSPDSDNKDPGSFGAPKPKAQHPATDQKGVSLSPTEGPAAGLGPDSETQMGGEMMKSVEKAKKNL